VQYFGLGRAIGRICLGGFELDGVVGLTGSASANRSRNFGDFPGRLKLIWFFVGFEESFYFLNRSRGND